MIEMDVREDDVGDVAELDPAFVEFGLQPWERARRSRIEKRNPRGP